MVKGTTRLVGLIGDPVAHSLSPLMHNSAFQAMQMDWAYLPLHVRPANLRDALRGIYSLGFLGVNVTVPYKEKALPFLDGLSDEAERIRAVNSITRGRGQISWRQHRLVRLLA